MAKIERFEDIEAWKQARILAREVYFLTQNSFSPKDTGIIRQINNAAGSTMDNIAEGFGRGGRKEFILFLGYSRGSNLEVQSQLYRTFDRNYISKEILTEFYEKERRRRTSQERHCEELATKQSCTQVELRDERLPRRSHPRNDKTFGATLN